MKLQLWREAMLVLGTGACSRGHGGVHAGGGHRYPVADVQKISATSTALVGDRTLRQRLLWLCHVPAIETCDLRIIADFWSILDAALEWLSSTIEVDGRIVPLMYSCVQQNKVFRCTVTSHLTKVLAESEAAHISMSLCRQKPCSHCQVRRA